MSSVIRIYIFKLMKILIVDNAAISQRDGIYYVYKSTGEFGRELKSFGHSVEFFQFFRKTPSSISDFNLIKHQLLFSTARIYKSKVLTYFYSYLKGSWRTINSDFVYIFYPNSFSFLAIFALVSRRKFGLYIRGEVGLHNWITKLLCKNASVVFTVSPSFTDMVNSFVLNPIAHTIRPMTSFTTGDMAKNRKFDKIADFNILFLGRIDRDKGLFELLEAVALIRSKMHIAFQVSIIGGGSDLDLLKDLAATLNILDIVNFKGVLSDVQEVRNEYLNSDIFVLPTYHEGFPRTLYEAMIFGVPIITTFVGGISALMRDGYNCFEIQPKSVESIVEIVGLVMNNYKDTEKVVHNGFLTVSEVFNSSKQSHAAHLNQILKSK